MKTMGTLTLEQEFKLQVLKQQIESLTHQQSQEYLLEAFRQMMVKDNLFKQMLKDSHL